MKKIPSGFENLLGVVVDKKQNGASILRLTKREELTNYHGYFHGGVLASLCDMACVQALMTLDGGPYYTVELSIRYKNPADGQEIFAQAEAAHYKLKFFLTQIKIIDREEKLIAEGTVKSYLPNFKTKES